MSIWQCRFCKMNCLWLRAHGTLSFQKRSVNQTNCYDENCLVPPLSNRRAMFDLIALFAGFTLSWILDRIKIEGKRKRFALIEHTFSLYEWQTRYPLSMQMWVCFERFVVERGGCRVWIIHIRGDFKCLIRKKHSEVVNNVVCIFI